MKKKNRLPVAFGALLFAMLLYFSCRTYFFDPTSDSTPTSVDTAEVAPILEAPLPSSPFKSMTFWKGDVETALGKYDVCVTEVWPGKNERSAQTVCMRVKGAYDVWITGVKQNSDPKSWKEVKFSRKELLSSDQIAHAAEELDLALIKVRKEEYLIRPYRPEGSDDLSRMGQ